MHSNQSLLYTLIHWAVSAMALMITAYLIRGFRVRNFLAALMAAAVIGFANIFIWPVLIFLTLPLNVLTLGLFTFVVNGMVLKICAWLLPGFEIRTWSAAIFGALVLSLVGAALHYILV
jgi:putative membrane protein